MSGTVTGIPVIRHQTRRIQFDPRTFDRLDHPPRKCLDVVCLGQQRCAPIASVEQVIKTIRLVRPGRSSLVPTPIPQHNHRTLPIPPDWYLTPFLSRTNPSADVITVRWPRHSRRLASKLSNHRFARKLRPPSSLRLHRPQTTPSTEKTPTKTHWTSAGHLGRELAPESYKCLSTEHGESPEISRSICLLDRRVAIDR